MRRWLKGRWKIVIEKLMDVFLVLVLLGTLLFGALILVILATAYLQALGVV